MKVRNLTAFLLLCSLLFFACKKKLDVLADTDSATTKKGNVAPKGFFIENLKVPGVAGNTAASRNYRSQSAPDSNNGDIPIVLGQQLANPYTVANMQQAVNTLYGGNYPITASHLYVRFKPASVEQFMMLEETEDLELQDYPMDYEVTQDGDYYQDPNLGTEDFGWLYTAVPVGYSFPGGIQHQVIDSLYLPEDNETLEDMAESMAAGAQYSSVQDENSDTVRINRTDAQAETFNYSGEQCPCQVFDQCPVWPDCGVGGGGGGTTGNDPRIPRGTIQVQDQAVCNGDITNIAVRQARIVCKRWFKIDRTYTNDQGQFVSSKKFKNKVKVNFKTKNPNAVVRKIRGIRIWQMLFPVKRRIGVFDQGDLAAISHLISKPVPTNNHDPELAYWVAATTHNSAVEYREYAAEFGIGLPPSGLKILISNWGAQRGLGSTPMWNKCSSLYSDFSTFKEYIEFFIAMSTYVFQANLFGFLKNQMDVTIGYAAPEEDYNCLLTSASIRAIAYHELGHTSHYAQAGCDYWQAYRVRIANEILNPFDGAAPYGDGTETNAGVVAVGEMWGNHCEKLFSERHYANPVVRETFAASGGIFVNDGSPFINYAGRTTLQVNGLNANFAAIESFNPNNMNNVHRWIPEGLPYDLMDNRNDFNTNTSLPVDNVAGYTAQQCFSALQGNVRTIPAFRDRLLQQNANSQAAAVTDLFFRYGY